MSMRLTQKFLYTIIFVIQCCFNFTAYADNGSAGRIIAKFKMDGRLTSLKQNADSTGSFYDPTHTSIVSLPYTSQVSLGSVVGGTGSAAYFFTDHIAAEVSGGYFSNKIKAVGNGPQYITPAGTTTPTFVNNWPYYQSTTGKFIPFAAILQYHIAPYGKLIPYIGVGYHYTFGSGSNGSKVGDSHGPVFQVGADGWVGENLILGIDVKKMMMKPKLTFVTVPSSGSPSNIIPINTKLKMDPLIISLGIGYRF
ncbi:Outer membrane protein W [Rickettsiales bacterium Ac37b]|nr:Outer membrane protein W [Rickettsiales bacterium Ac37b]